MSDIFDRRSPFFLILGVLGWGRVYDIMGFKHRWLVKPVQTKLSITNDKLRVEQYLCEGGFHQQ
ncbi:hypothetical protein QUB25_00885 [Microcoleus sp. B3-D7]